MNDDIKMKQHTIRSIIVCAVSAIFCSNLRAEAYDKKNHIPVKTISRNKNNRRILKKGDSTKGKGKKNKDKGNDDYHNDDDYNYNDDHESYDDDQYYNKGKGISPPPPLPTPPVPAPTSLPNVVDRNCKSAVAQSIINAIPEVITQNPSRCCQYDGPVGVYITHSLPSNDTSSGFESFWNIAYETIANRSQIYNLCFVMTGYNPDISQRSLTDIMISTNRFVSTLNQVPAMMTTDPTDTVRLATEVRFIYDSIMNGPSIGVFNCGYNNLNIESIISQKERLSYIGYINDNDYGKQSALFAQQLLLSQQDDIIPKPLCFNGRPDLLFIGERCASFYKASSINNTGIDITPQFGIPCSSDSTIEEIYSIILGSKTNSILSHVDCCSVVSYAVSRVIATTGNKIIIGCQDEDTSGGVIDYVTTQPIDEQMYHTSTYVQLPLQKAIIQNNNNIIVGRQNEYFPSLLSLIVTNIFSYPV